MNWEALKLIIQAVEPEEKHQELLEGIDLFLNQLQDVVQYPQHSYFGYHIAEMLVYTLKDFMEEYKQYPTQLESLYQLLFTTNLSNNEINSALDAALKIEYDTVDSKKPIIEDKILKCISKSYNEGGVNKFRKIVATFKDLSKNTKFEKTEVFMSEQDKTLALNQNLVNLFPEEHHSFLFASQPPIAVLSKEKGEALISFDLTPVHQSIAKYTYVTTTQYLNGIQDLGKLSAIITKMEIIYNSGLITQTRLQCITEAAKRNAEQNEFLPISYKDAVESRVVEVTDRDEETGNNNWRCSVM